MSVPLSDTRLTEIRERHALKVSMGLIRADDNEGVLLAEIDRLRAKLEERWIELRDRRTEDLNLRGLLAPNGLPRRVPMELGASLVPAVEWLLAELAKAQGQVRAASTVKCWTNEDGRRFVFAENLAFALGYTPSGPDDGGPVRCSHPECRKVAASLGWAREPWLCRDHAGELGAGQ